MNKTLLAIMMTIYCCGIWGCAMPVTSVRTVDDRPSLIIKGAQESSILFVDGLSMGPANQFNGDPNALIVESGTHTVSIIDNGKPILEQRVFVESSQKTIIVK